jgi:hypothetical protein
LEALQPLAQKKKQQIIKIAREDDHDNAELENDKYEHMQRHQLEKNIVEPILENLRDTDNNGSVIKDHNATFMEYQAFDRGEATIKSIENTTNNSIYISQSKSVDNESALILISNITAKKEIEDTAIDIGDQEAASAIQLPRQYENKMNAFLGSIMKVRVNVPKISNNAVSPTNLKENSVAKISNPPDANRSGASRPKNLVSSSFKSNNDVSKNSKLKNNKVFDSKYIGQKSADPKKH